MDIENRRISGYAGLLANTSIDEMNDNLDYMLSNYDEINPVDCSGKMNALYMECCIFLIDKFMGMIKGGVEFSYYTTTGYSSFVEKLAFDRGELYSNTIGQWREMDMNCPLDDIVRKLRNKGHNIQITVSSEQLDKSQKTYKIEIS